MAELFSIEFEVRLLLLLLLLLLNELAKQAAYLKALNDESVGGDDDELGEFDASDTDGVDDDDADEAAAAAIMAAGGSRPMPFVIRLAWSAVEKFCWAS